MAVIDEQKYFERKEEMIDFIKQNKKECGGYYFSLLEFLKYDDGLELQEFCPVQIRQIFSKFDLYLEGADEYKVIANLLKNYSLLERNCAEIGAGFYPRLSEIVLPMLKGKLTIYEPAIRFTDFNAKIIKHKFTRRSNINDVDTLFSLYPCKATIPMLEKAFNEDKNILLAFCSCNHSTSQHKKRGSKYWAYYVCEDYQKKYGSEIEILKWPPAVKNLDLPILVRKSSKQLKKSIGKL